jgi:hypothetical protein
VTETQSRLDGVLRWFTAIRERAQLKRVQRPLLIIATVGFVVMTIIGFRHLPHAPEPVRWWLLIFFVVTTPIGVAFNAAEYQISARLVGHRVSIVAASRVAVLGSAFNLLPVPGAVMVRTQALKEAGHSYGRAIGTTGVTGAGYLGMGFAAAGLALVANRPGVAVLFLAIAVLFSVLTFVGVRAYVRKRVSWYGLIVLAVEMGSVVIKSAAFLIVGRAVGYNVTIGQALIVNLSTVITAAVGILPGGLGLRELLAGVLSPLAGLQASVGLVIAAFSRVLGLVALAGMAGILYFAPEHPDEDREALEAAHDMDPEFHDAAAPTGTGSAGSM